LRNHYREDLLTGHDSYERSLKMKHSKIIAAGAFAAALALPGYAVAQSAIATTDVNMREGPGTRFQVITTVPSDRTVTLHGCERGFDWCAVSWNNSQGWVFADYLEVNWRGERHAVSDVGARIDLPIVRGTAGAQMRADTQTWQDRRQGDQAGERRYEVEPDATLADPGVQAGPRAGTGDFRDQRRWEVEPDASLAPTTGSVGQGPRASTWQDRREGDQAGERRWEVEPDAVLRQ